MRKMSLAITVLVLMASGATAQDALFVAPSGNVGIGTSAPGARLHVFCNATSDVFASFGPNPTTGPALNFGYAGTSLGRGAAFLNTRPDASAVAPNPSLRFMTVDVERVIITNAGSVGIGTSAPSSRLHVNGGDIRVSSGSFIDDGTTLNVPDYVFEPDYALTSLPALKEFIAREKHLPNVPSAAEIKANGLKLGQFQLVLLEKVEELTLHTIAQSEEIESLRARNTELDAELRGRLAAIEQALGLGHQ